MSVIIAHMQTCMPPLAHTYTVSHIHLYTHTRAHTCTCAHTHKYCSELSPVKAFLSIFVMPFPTSTLQGEQTGAGRCNWKRHMHNTQCSYNGYVIELHMCASLPNQTTSDHITSHYITLHHITSHYIYCASVYPGCQWCGNNVCYHHI